MDYKYNILAFVCLKWGYGAADLAGVGRLKYSQAIKIVKLRCTGRVDVKHLLYAIKSGADGVAIVGWHPNECQFKTGNFTAQRHVDFANKILDSRVFGSKRINMYWCSSAESEKFVKSMEDAFEKVKREGPNPVNLEQSKFTEKKLETITNP